MEFRETDSTAGSDCWYYHFDTVEESAGVEVITTSTALLFFSTASNLVALPYLARIKSERRTLSSVPTEMSC